MRNLIILFVMIFTLSVNAQQKTEIEPILVESAKLDGTTKEFDLNQPAKNISEEDAVFKANKCVRFLLLQDYYALKSLHYLKDKTGVASNNFNLKSSLYYKLYKVHECTNDAYYRFKILQGNVYKGMQKELFE